MRGVISSKNPIASLAEAASAGSILILVLLAAPLAARAAARAPQQRHPRQAGEARMLYEAGRVADQLIERFHRTLDFRPVFDEFFVRGPQLRRRVLELHDDERSTREWSDATRERVYVAFMTYLHLFAEYKLIQDVNEVPPEVTAAYDETSFMRTSGPPPDPEKFIADAERISALYRKHFGAGAFESALYRRNIREVRESYRTNGYPVASIEHGSVKFGIDERTPVYVIQRELFEYNFIEEEGRPRLFFVNILPHFKLF